MVTRQALQQDRGLLEKGRVEVGVAEAGAWCGERGLREADVGKPGDLLRLVPRISAAISQKSPNSG